ncbi:AraC family transcriptional regulator [Brucella sp. NM4]|uniref:helix-turn-helix domain-containing protein n=1 Tax=Brucella sp. NM4 TaxID=3045175 RepID=UPI0024BD0FA0|nr:AraC family transcriptional regulator [Brucella sp. NM4]WHS33906.1 AraC family transcriptional regulator [Brucella sp. NM4]
MSFYRVTETGPISPVSLSDLPGAIATNIQQLLEQANFEVDRDIEAVRACLEKARALLRSEPKENAMGGLAPWQMKRVIQYIECNLSETIRCEDLAAVCRLSVSHFSKIFRHSFGVTPHAYVQQMRIERSKELLAETKNL